MASVASDEVLEAGLKSQVNLRELWASFKIVALPYWKAPAMKWESRGWAMALLLFAIARSGMSILYSYMGKNFWDYLSEKKEKEFYRQLVLYILCFAVGTPVTAFYRWVKDQLIIRWRRWLTADLLTQYLSGRAYYRLTLPLAEGADAPATAGTGAGEPGAGPGKKTVGIDNPDQRIASDANTFTQVSVDLLLVILTAVLDLISFSYIMHSIYPPLFGVLIVYSLLGTAISTWIGKQIAVLAFIFLRREADFRYSLIRIRDNAEAIAFYGGEREERGVALSRLERLIALGFRLVTWNRHLALFTIAYTVFIQVLPLSVIGPKYFTGDLTLGQVQQSYMAFNHILDDLSIVVTQVSSLINLSAVSERLSTLVLALRRLSQDGAPDPSEPEPGVSPAPSPSPDARVEMSSLLRRSQPRSHAGGGAPSPGGALAAGQLPPLAIPREGVRLDVYEGTTDPDSGYCVSLEGLTVTTPDGARVLLSGLSHGMGAGRRLLVMGPSGAGKSSLLRTVAGLWSFGSGAVARPADALFLPQRPYMVLGSLRDQLLYPKSSGRPGEEHAGDAALQAALEAVNLPGLAGRYPGGLDEVADWSATLSVGEQQRLAFARLLLARPALAILDEATGALDEENEARLYAALRAALPGAAVLSVGHRRTLLAHHDDLLVLSGDASGTCRLAPAAAAAVEMGRGGGGGGLL